MTLCKVALLVNIAHSRKFHEPTPESEGREAAVGGESSFHPRTKQRMIFRMHRFLQWLFRNRETGAITIAQAPNLVLRIVIVGSVLIWAWRPAGNLGVALEIVVKAGIFVWAIDEVLRGANPWRRCLGAAMLGYELMTML
jgi:hypothetical protein